MANATPDGPPNASSASTLEKSGGGHAGAALAESQAPKEKTGDSDAPRAPHSAASSSSDASSDSECELDDHIGTAASWRYPYFAASASYRRLDFVGGWHQYTLNGFSIAAAMGCGMRVCSDFFRVGGQLFRLEIYPAGVAADVRKHVSIFLTTPGSIVANQVFHEISILDQSGKEKHITVKRDKKQGPCVCMYRGVLAAHPRFVKLKELTDKPKRYLRGDTLVVRATVEVVRSWTSSPPSSGAEMPHTFQGHGNLESYSQRPQTPPFMPPPQPQPASIPSALPHRAQVQVPETQAVDSPYACYVHHLPNPGHSADRGAHPWHPATPNNNTHSPPAPQGGRPRHVAFGQGQLHHPSPHEAQPCWPSNGQQSSGLLKARQAPAVMHSAGISAVRHAPSLHPSAEPITGHWPHAQALYGPDEHWQQGAGGWGV